MSHAIAIPENMFSATAAEEKAAPSLSDDIVMEVERQLVRKFAEKFGGNLNLADAVSLYANSVEGAGLIRSVNTNRDGSDNRNDKNFGNVFEAMEVFQHNREGVVSGDGRRAARTDDLSVQRQDGSLEHASLERHANLYDQHTDVVVYGTDGEILETQQLKHVRGAMILIEPKYTTDPDAPDVIVVPKDMLGRHQEKLRQIAEHAHDPEDRKRAGIALQKLRPGKTDSMWTGRPDKDEHFVMAWIVEKTGGSRGAVGRALPYAGVAAQTAADAMERAAGRTGAALMAECCSLVVGGAVWEVRDAREHPGSMGVMDRMQRLFVAVWSRLRASALARGGRELALEAFNMVIGVVSGLCGSLKSLLQLIGRSVTQIWDSIWNYVTGKISSFAELLAVIGKTVAAVGIGALAVMLEQKLAAFGLPSPISGLLAAALAGVAIVFANRGIDALVFSMAGTFSWARAAELRREKIAAYCDEMIPKLLADRAAFEKMANAWYAERRAVLQRSFAGIREATEQGDARRLYASLEEINRLYGATLGWSTQEEFDSMMESDEAFKL